MKKTRIMQLAVLLLLSSCLSACQLAKPALQDNSEAELFGVYVLASEEQQVIAEKPYALITETTEYDLESQATYINQSYSFPGLNGFIFVLPSAVEQEENSYLCYKSDEAISDMNTVISDDEDGRKVAISASFYACHQGDGNYYQVFPVYRDKIGVYLGQSEGSYYVSTLGEQMSQLTATFQESQTKSINAKKQGQEFSVTINISSVFMPVKIVILQLNKDHKVLKIEEFKPDALVDEIIALPECAYFIVENFKVDSAGQETVKREIVDRQTEWFTVFRPVGKNACAKFGIRAVWQ